MADKIVISDGRKKEKKQNDTKLYVADTLKNATADTGSRASPETDQMPLDENVWGNDYTILHQLDEKQLADRRLFVRVRYFQKIECNAISDTAEIEPSFLRYPLTFMISDLSMSGIGIICDDRIDIGKVLAIQIMLDGIQYTIKCEVMYCLSNDDKFRAGLKIVEREKQFIRHLKIFIARISLIATYGNQAEKE